MEFISYVFKKFDNELYNATLHVKINFNIFDLQKTLNFKLLYINFIILFIVEFNRIIEHFSNNIFENINKM